MATTFTPELNKVAQRYKLALKQQDAKVLSDLTRQYGRVYLVANQEMMRLASAINAKLEAGESITPGWLARQARLDRLQVQVGRALDRFLTDAAEQLSIAQQWAVQEAMKYAEKATNGALGEAPAGAQFSQFWANLDQAAIQNILANTAPGGPVEKILQNMVPQGASEARQVIVNGVAQGYNPNKIAQELHQQLGAPLARAQTIARTEVMRAQREVTLGTYQANSDVVRGWVWSSAMDERTCDECWALEGTFFAVEESPEVHINCRCTLVPEVGTYADMGFGDRSSCTV